MLRTCIKSVFVCGVLLAMSGCDGRSFQQWLAGAPKPESAEQRVASSKAAAIAKGTPNLQGLDADTKTDINAKSKYQAVVYQMLSQERFDDLDQLANTLRQSKSKFSGGSWKLYTFYSGLEQFPGKPTITDPDWEDRIELLKRWGSQKPDSITAKVALADAYHSYAWNARGSGYANQVGDNQWKLFGERIDQARQVLEQASHLNAKCPQWYEAMFHVALGQSWSKEEEDALFERAITFEPTYSVYYTQHAKYLMPQWFGEEGDWENFAEQLSTRLGPKQGAIAYYRIAIRMNCCDYDANAIFTKANLSWDKVKAGCQAAEQLYGPSLENLNDCARLAGEAEDRRYAKQLFVRIGDNWNPETWRLRQSFDQARAWAMSEN